MKLAEVFSSQPNRLWHLAKQLGVDHAVGGLPWEEKIEKPWDLMPLIRMKQRFQDFGLELTVIESMPPSAVRPSPSAPSAWSFVMELEVAIRRPLSWFGSRGRKPGAGSGKPS